MRSAAWLPLVAALGLVPACAAPAPTPRELPWAAHALSAAKGHTLVLTDLDPIVEAGTIESDGTAVPAPVDANNEPLPLMLPVATAVAVGTQHACILSTQQVTCWGEDNHGALGAQRACISPASCILGPEVMPTLPPIRAIAAGDDVTCAVAQTDEVMCWGKQDGRLGGSVVSALDPPVPVPMEPGKSLKVDRVIIRDDTVCAIDRDQRAWCWGGVYGAHATKLDLTGVVDIAVNDDHGCAISAAGLQCWGNNSNGQVAPAQAAACGASCTTPVTAVPVANATRVVVGARHSCALDSGGTVWCWGDNEAGQLARPDIQLAEPVGIAFTGATDLVAGDFHTCALGPAASAWCWGEN